MKTEVINNFLKIQSCTLILVLALLPEFNLLSMLTGFDFNFAMLIGELICIIGIGFNLFKLYKSRQISGETLPIPYLVTNGGGAILALLSLIPSIPDWVSYFALILLFVSMFLAKKVWLCQWNFDYSQGAYMILLAVLTHSFSFVNSTMATTIAAFIGLIVYWIGLSKLKTGMDEIGKSAAGKLKLAIIFGIAALIFDKIPLMGIISMILAVVAFVLEFIGYGKLKSSLSIGTEGAMGAQRLRNSMIVMVIASVVGFMSDSISGFITLIALFMLYSGWTQITIGMETKDNSEQ